MKTIWSVWTFLRQSEQTEALLAFWRGKLEGRKVVEVVTYEIEIQSACLVFYHQLECDRGVYVKLKVR